MASENFHNKVILLQSRISKLIFEYEKRRRQIKKLEEENGALKKELEKKKVVYDSSGMSLTKEEINNYLKAISACIEILEDMDHER